MCVCVMYVKCIKLSYKCSIQIQIYIEFIYILIRNAKLWFYATDVHTMATT